MIWVAPVILLFSFALVFYPLFTKRGARPLPVGFEGDLLVELAFDRDLLLRQLKELALEEGAAQDLAQKTKLENELGAVLAALDQLEKSRSTSERSNPERTRNPLDGAWGVSVMLVVALLSGGLYLMKGTPQNTLGQGAVVDSRGEPAPGAQEAPDIAAMVQNLAERLQSEPENKEGWARLARSYSVLDQVDQAIAAYSHLLTLDPHDQDTRIGLAEVLVRSGDSESVQRGLKHFEEVLQQDPDRPEALWFTGALAFQAGKMDVAIQKWEHLLKQLPPDTADHDSVTEAIRRAKEP
ncbi:MAG: hypothetical protein HQL67_01885 [Magnetococcales bacterium]|nr:hypothetical protein [Magnetococcales bacterium]